MAFLSPLFLLGLAALAIPVLAHLVHKQDATVMAFPSLMFLERAPSPLQRRREIRQWFLLALRCLALTLIVLAFAQPFFRSDPATAAVSSERRDLVLLLDRSYSMGYGDHWRSAREAAQKALEDLSGKDRVALVHFDTEAQVAMELGSDPAAVARAVAALEPGYRSTDYIAGLRRAARVVEESDATAREILLISDFQRSGWNTRSSLALDEDIRLDTVAIGAGEPENRAVWIKRLDHLAEPGSVAVEIATHNGGTASEPLRVTLSSEGTAVQSLEMGGSSGSDANSELVASTPARGTARSELRIPADRLEVDNTFRWSMRAERPIRVLMVEGPRPRTHQSDFLAEALRLSEQPRFTITTKKQDQLAPGDLGNATVVVLNEAQAPNKEVEQALVRFVEAGGGLLVVAGAAATDMARLGPPELVPTLTSRLPGSPPRSAVRITWVDGSHPALSVFSAPDRTDLSSARISRYSLLQVESQDSVLARYDDGGAALVERRHGSGRVITLSTTADTEWGDLPLQPTFLPLTHELMRHLAGHTPIPPWHTVGAAVDLSNHFSAHPDAEAADLRSIETIVVESPSGDQIRLPAESPILVLEEPGWYELHAPGGKSLRDLLAANVDPVESNLAPMPVSELDASVDRVSDVRPSIRSEVRATVEPAEDAPHLWWYLLLLAALVLGTETLISNRISRALS